MGARQLTIANGQQATWRRGTWIGVLAALTIAVLVVHGYHPLAEDGGLYLAGVEYTLDPRLFPHYTQFVTEHLRFSVFAVVVAGVVRATHLSMAAVVFALELVSIFSTLAGARAIARRVFVSDLAQLGAVSLLAAWWTLPVAGTSLMLMDPYVTARSFTMPLSLFAIALAMDGWASRRSVLLCGVCLLVAFVLHPLMAAIALGFVLVLWSQEVVAIRSRRRNAVLLLLATLVLAGIVQAMGPPESAALKAAIVTRYYWFLSQWQWYELLGVLAPPLIFTALLRWGRLRESGRVLCFAASAAGGIAVCVAMGFAREDMAVHAVARLQPLRVYVLVYAVMALLLGGVFVERMQRRNAQWMMRAAPFAAIAVISAVMGWVQRETFPASIHLEVPWRAEANPNPWVQAFLWGRENTPLDAVFALDAKYVNRDGEDAQTFRAIARRSAVPDYSKDGGEAAITPSLAEVWQRGAAVQKGLSAQTDAVRDANLQETGATWVVLLVNAPTLHACPYRNDTVKVCSLVATRGR
ncbi:MAG: hypothetical protein ABI142_06795 [Bryocella sp.]